MQVDEEVKVVIELSDKNDPNFLNEYHKVFKSNATYESAKRHIRRIRPKPIVIGVIGDTHLPFEHPNYLKFLKETFKKWGVTEVVHIGDLVDNHAISRHNTEVDAMGGYSEYSMAKQKLQTWIETFPNMKLCLGNHDTIHSRQAKTLALHYGFIKTFSEAWDLPKSWIVQDEFIIDDVVYTHGLSTGGMHGTLNYANTRRKSVVCGHKHSVAGVRYSNNGESNIFALDVGCGVDDKSYAVRYGKTMPKKPIIGAGIVISNTEAYFIPMKKDL